MNTGYPSPCSGPKYHGRGEAKGTVVIAYVAVGIAAVDCYEILRFIPVIHLLRYSYHSDDRDYQIPSYVSRMVLSL